ncbi:MAG TPA: NADH-quinone oxidoreductase subunit C [Gemmatimonadales bacterium]|nr:NADH-quinone oxidoreductase subunit C [Gemmatimonadales bacterium]
MTGPVLPAVASAAAAEVLVRARGTADALRSRFGDAILRQVESAGQLAVYVDASTCHDILAWLRDEPAQQFDYLCDITAVEYRDPELPLEVCYQLRSLPNGIDLRIKVPFDPEGVLELPSCVDLWAGADWLERETWDMFGVIFDGHPALTHILMPDDWDGHPQRKDYPLGGIPVEYHDATIPPPDTRRAYR